METRPRQSGERLPLPATALAVLAGDTLVQCQPQLVAWVWPLVGALALLLWARRDHRVRWVVFVLLACAWTAWRADLALQGRLPHRLAGRNIEVTGRIAGLPRTGAEARRFVLDVGHAERGGRPLAFDGRVHLSWYGHAHDARVAPCSRWRFRVRLKRPRAYLDPGSFDSERSALQKGVDAVGYVRHEGPNRPLPSRGACLARLRQAVAARIATAVPDVGAANLLAALAVGDKRGISDTQWRVARRTGTSHLLAISGFHIGVAALLGVLLVRLLWWIAPALGRCVPRPPVEAVLACLCAAAYAALAGFALPTLRALLMIATATLARCSRRRVGAMDALALALLTIVAVDPLAVLSAGFWLSFAGVAFLLLCLGAAGRRGGGYLQTLGHAQLVMTVTLLPLTAWFFGQASLVGAAANLIAVPVVSLLVVPLTLLGTMLLVPVPAVAGLVLRAAARIMQVQWWMLQHMATWPLARWYLPHAPWWALPLAALGALWLFLPRGLGPRWLGLVLMLPLLVPARRVPAMGGFTATVLDVGQGLSVIVRTRHHALLFDAGPRYPSGFDLGRAVVIPALHALDVQRLDVMMISHGDNDHAGGAPAVARTLPVGRLLGGEPERVPLPLKRCAVGQHWRWDGVRLRVLDPPRERPPEANDRSCVLLISGMQGRLLLTGDISRRMEPSVSRRVPAGPPLMLVVPHHGSNSSSSALFVRALHPVLGVVSAGWHNRYGLPSAKAMARYRAAGVPILGTARSGAVQLRFPAHGRPVVVARWRLRRRRYWRE